MIASVAVVLLTRGAYRWWAWAAVLASLTGATCAGLSLSKRLHGDLPGEPICSGTDVSLLIA